MRIKIIGDNNCARATRHLLRMAGFAVTDFLPVEAITHAPHSGYAITIELAPAAHPMNPSGKSSGRFPASAPDHATHQQTAVGEASSSVGGASSRLSVRRGGELGEAEKSMETDAMVGTETAGRDGAQMDRLVQSENADRKGRQAEACPTGGGQAAGYIQFDSVDSLLEAAVLRHVSQLAGDGGSSWGACAFGEGIEDCCACG